MRFLLACLALVALVLAKTPNEKLRTCCNTLKGVDKECVGKFCDFNGISQTSILAFLDQCSTETVGKMWDCASLRHDHTKCCETAGVNPDCMAYCAATNGAPTEYSKYLFCLDDFNKIKDCFHEHLEKNEPYKPHH